VVRNYNKYLKIIVPMKKQFLTYLLLIILLFTACARTTFKGAEGNTVTRNGNNIF
jgi:hypothetical protein